MLVIQFIIFIESKIERIWNNNLTKLLKKYSYWNKVLIENLFYLTNKIPIENLFHLLFSFNFICFIWYVLHIKIIYFKHMNKKYQLK